MSGMYPNRRYLSFRLNFLQLSLSFNGTRGRGELLHGDEKRSEKFPLNHRPKEHCTRGDRNQPSIGRECRTAVISLGVRKNDFAL